MTSSPAPTNTRLTIPQLKRPPALAVKSPLSSAHAPRPLSRTPSTDPDAHAVLVPLASAPATVLLPRTLLLAVLHVLADLVLKVCGTYMSWVSVSTNNYGLGGCTCEKAADGGFNPANEIDFTTKK